MKGKKTLQWGQDGGFSIFSRKIWATPSKDWQNLGTPFYIFFNNTPICVLCPYLSYFRCFFYNSYFAKSGRLAKSGCPLPTNGEIWVYTQKHLSPVILSEQSLIHICWFINLSSIQVYNFRKLRIQFS